MTPRASRSFTDPSGLNASILTNRFTPGGARRLILTTGVLPTVSRMLPNFAMRAFSQNEMFPTDDAGITLYRVLGGGGDRVARARGAVDPAQRTPRMDASYEERSFSKGEGAAGSMRKGNRRITLT